MTLRHLEPMPKPLLTILVALGTAAVLTALGDSEPFMAKLVRLEARDALPEMEALLREEPVAVSAVMLTYAPDEALRLSAQLALLRYPRMTRQVLPLYGMEPEFRQVLSTHGPDVMPPIAYFMHNEVASLMVMRAAGEALSEARNVALRLLGQAPAEHAAAATTPQPLTADQADVERGWYAVAFIRDEGHDFLGQFVVNDREEVEWVQTERVTEAASAFFTSGIRALETRYRLDQDPRASDFLWAGVDIALVAGAAKVLRAGRATATGARTGAASAARASLATRAVVAAGRGALRLGRYGVPLAVGYAVVRHPSLIASLAAQAAALVGWPVPLVQGAVWFLLLVPVLALAHLVLRWAVRPCLVLLRTAARGLIWLEHWTRRPQPAPSAPVKRIEPRVGDLSRADGAPATGLEADGRGER